MAKYYLTKKAIEDLSNIWYYTFEEWSELQADRYYKMLIENFKEISQNPNLGNNYEDISPKLFGLKTEKHIISCRILVISTSSEAILL